MIFGQWSATWADSSLVRLQVVLWRAPDSISHCHRGWTIVVAIKWHPPLKLRLGCAVTTWRLSLKPLCDSLCEMVRAQRRFCPRKWCKWCWRAERKVRGESLGELDFLFASEPVTSSQHGNIRYERQYQPGDPWNRTYSLQNQLFSGLPEKKQRFSLIKQGIWLW